MNRIFNYIVNNFLNIENRRKNAWTMVELIICIIVIIALSSFLISSFKSKSQKAKIYIYATIKNLTRANNDIFSTEESLELGENAEHMDIYCLKVADAFSTFETPDCKIDANELNNNKKANMTLSNGVTIFGLTSQWKEPFTDAGYKYRDILIDIDGNAKGKNKVWFDRFPLRIYDHPRFKGFIYAVDCGKDYIYQDADTAKVLLKSPYCQAGDNKGILDDEDYVAYDVFRTDSLAAGRQNGNLKIGLQPTIKADCLANGGFGLYSTRDCYMRGYRVLNTCVTDEVCEACDSISGVNNCPATDDGVVVTGDDCKALRADKNPENLRCFSLIHKPTGGVNMLLDSVIGEIDP